MAEIDHLLDATEPSNKPIEDSLKTRTILVAAVFARNSPYREVRSVFNNHDNTDTPCGTIRAYVIGIMWAAGLAALNTFYAPRNPSISLSVYIAQIFAYPMGRFCAATLPTRVFLPDTKYAFTLNPGPFNVKEHMLITIMADITTLNVFAIPQIIFALHLPMFLDRPWAGKWGFQLCLLLCAQVCGFSLCGLTRRFIIYPVQMIFYSSLGEAALIKALHNEDTGPVGGWKISRFSAFFITFGAMFCYFWLPNTIFPTLTFFNWTTWIAPRNAALSILTGSYYFNLGLNPLVNSFDWNWFAGVIDPIVNPFFVVLQLVLAVLVWAVAVIIPVFFSNTWHTAYLPINAFYTFDNTGKKYSVQRILDSHGRLNQTGYEEYSPLFFPAALVLRYGVLLAIIPAALVFTGLYYGKTFWSIFKSAWKRRSVHDEFPDAHSRLMTKYREGLQVWYISVGVVGAAFGFAALYAYPTDTPGWIIPVIIVMSMVFVVPFGAILAIASYEANFEILFDLISSYITHNNPSAFLLFRGLGNAIITQALAFMSDMKLGHYAKIPPRHMFAAQVSSVCISSVTIVAVVNYQLGLKEMCDPKASDHWICGSVHTSFTSVIGWGLLGARRMFTHVGAPYWKIMFCLLAGALWPLPWYFAKKRWPGSVLRHVHPILLLLGGVLWAPLNFSMFAQAVPFAWFFGSYIKTRSPGWWSKYAMVLSTALTAGIGVSALVQFFAITNAKVEVYWWGTTKYSSTCDFKDCRYMSVPKGQTFGPTDWR
ncbi:uncharacterized protein MYCFIDRAFT_143283 [Pseudocercospora fijiensis CIRAD86]|uniref:Uncharacterized protein n=1 Tax=Pseudocercospora fijiensis (strain CIRAD86) TaxID=383855 RepID=M3APB0_PSEFD|nr:uncharacterized protein MYCFIDRAFT_143283 [Pseudocercospora fijiensis CIRAD86]EME78963.1 hypothetical protein MYCFIDRAFT_143283 [Pseudocercospora fijiensis CIRAD86]